AGADRRAHRVLFRPAAVGQGVETEGRSRPQHAPRTGPRARFLHPRQREPAMAEPRRDRVRRWWMITPPRNRWERWVHRSVFFAYVIGGLVVAGRLMPLGIGSHTFYFGITGDEWVIMFREIGGRLPYWVRAWFYLLLPDPMSSFAGGFLLRIPMVLLFCISAILPLLDVIRLCCIASPRTRAVQRGFDMITPTQPAPPLRYGDDG